jgi:hypothetical protein
MYVAVGPNIDVYLIDVNKRLYARLLIHPTVATRSTVVYDTIVRIASGGDSMQESRVESIVIESAPLERVYY